MQRPTHQRWKRSLHQPLLCYVHCNRTWRHCMHMMYRSEIRTKLFLTWNDGLSLIIKVWYINNKYGIVIVSLMIKTATRFRCQLLNFSLFHFSYIWTCTKHYWFSSFVSLCTRLETLHMMYLSEIKMRLFWPQALWVEKVGGAPRARLQEVAILLLNSVNTCKFPQKRLCVFKNSTLLLNFAKMKAYGLIFCIFGRKFSDKWKIFWQFYNSPNKT